MASKQTLPLLLSCCLALLLCSTVSGAELEQSILATDKKSGCTFSVPASWGSNTMSWSGACKNKQVMGNGVARFMKGNKVVASWFGEVKNGTSYSGVLEYLDSSTSGNKKLYKLHVPQAPGIIDDGMLPIKALEKAADAANALASQFEKTGNKASAKYYRSKSDEIRYLMGG
jgi:hypothetical protein